MKSNAKRTRNKRREDLDRERDRRTTARTARRPGKVARIF
jgi:hypothetical protein